jgi:hypothetical protein
MNIKGKPEDMHAVLGLIQELAVFEKEPDAVLVTVDDLIAMVLALFLYFMFLLPKLKMTLLMRNKECNCRYRALLLSLFDLERKNNPSRFSSKDKMRGTGLGYALYSEIIKQGKRPRRVEWNVLDWNTPQSNFMKSQEPKYFVIGM